MADYQQGVPINIVDSFRVSGTLTNPTTVVYTITGPDGTSDTFTWPGDPEITNTGVGMFTLALGPPEDAGLYTYDVDATGAVDASRAGSFSVLANAAIDVEVPWAVGGPCTPWTSSQSVWGCCGQPTMTVEDVVCNVDFTAEAFAASQVLYELSGRRFSGSCSKTVRPCGGSPCGFQVLSRGHIVEDPYWAGNYWSQGSHRGCSCHALDEIWLSGYPVREVTEVKIDGVVVPEADNWRLDERRFLTRMADAEGNAQSWPSCQRIDMDDTEAGTFSVTYRYGMDPPLIGIHAAAELACELYKACNNSADCQLPQGVTRVVRQGITIERLAFSAWGLQEGIWRTGLTRVDTFLNAYNPGRARRRPSVWSPGGPRYARTVGQ